MPKKVLCKAISSLCSVTLRISTLFVRWPTEANNWAHRENESSEGARVANTAPPQATLPTLPGADKPEKEREEKDEKKAMRVRAWSAWLKQLWQDREILLLSDCRRGGIKMLRWMKAAVSLWLALVQVSSFEIAIGFAPERCGLEGVGAQCFAKLVTSPRAQREGHQDSIPWPMYRSTFLQPLLAL